MNLRRAAATAAILTALSMVLMLVMWMAVIPSTGLTQADMMDPNKIAAFALAHRGMWLLSTISDAICGLTLPFVTIALYRKFRKSQPGRAAVFGVFGVLSSSLFFAAGCISLLAPTFVARLANPEQIFAALGAIQQPIEASAVFLISVATWQVARAAHATRAFNAVTLYAAYLASLGVIFIPLTMIDMNLGMTIGMAPMIATIVYFFGLGANLMNPERNPELEAALAA